MTEIIFHKAGTRGGADQDWLVSRHTFSFADYYDPERMRFGALRVLNDDIVQGGGGFDTHPHRDMEIITIPLEGALVHRDSMGNAGTVKAGEVQLMSAGSGLSHSEHNASATAPLKLLQIWVLPDRKGVAPRYAQAAFEPAGRRDKFQQLLGPGPDGPGLWIYQKAWFHLGRFKKGKAAAYPLKLKGNGVYAFLISGKMQVCGRELAARDGCGVLGTDTISCAAAADSELLLMEVPML